MMYEKYTNEVVPMLEDSACEMSIDTSCNLTIPSLETVIIAGIIKMAAKLME